MYIERIKKMKKEKLKKIYEQIKKFDTIYIARHIGPDPDAISSQIALRDSIKLTFPEKKVYAIGSSVSKFKYIGKLDKIDDNISYENSLIITLDVPNKFRVDGISVDNFKHVVKIDHHPYVEEFSDLEYIDVDSCSTGEILLDLINNTKLKMDASIARCLLIGIISDSNRFLFKPCDYKILYKVADVIRIYKLNIQDIYNQIYLRPISEIRLMGYIDSNIKVTKNKLAYIILENDIVSSFGADASSASNMVNELSNIDEFLVWLFVTYDEKNEVFKISIRSRGPVINELAQKYNGGGHIYSSGARCKTREEVDNLIKDYDNLVREYLKNNN